MSKERLPITNQLHQQKLEAQIQILQQELEAVEQEIRTFEAVLRTHLSDLIVEAQELFILYKQIKKAKKGKRLAQKKKGKNYKESQGLKSIPQEKKKPLSPKEQQEKKRLYREALLHVHPDKFSMSEEETEIATEITSHLIDIYKTGTLETLQAYHTHIFKGNTALRLSEVASSVTLSPQAGDYLQQEKEGLEKALNLAKNRQLYKVLKDYEQPLIFVEELKAYYEDRIFKLRKRTRKGLEG